MSSNHAVNSKILTKHKASYSKKDASSFLKSNQNVGFKKKFKTMFTMLQDREFKLSDSTKLMFMGALGYVIMPFDIVPDFVPVAGWIDDAAVIGAVWGAAKGDIQKFLFQHSNKNSI